MPADLEKAIKDAYIELAARIRRNCPELIGDDLPMVAVRSSATAEDLPDASFAGQQDMYLNVVGGDEVVRRSRSATPPALRTAPRSTAKNRANDHMNLALSAAIQMMVFSKVSGVMFSVNISNGDDTKIIIEAAYGLGEYVVQGIVTPDNYLIDKKTLQIVSRDVHVQNVMYACKPGGDCEEREVAPEDAIQQKLTNKQILELAGYAKRLEEHYGRYMDMEWGIDERTGKTWLLQARPETVWSRKTRRAPRVPPAKSL